MAEFFYRALDRNDETRTGVLDAANVAAATAELHKRGLTPVEVNGGKKTLAMRLNEPVELFSAAKPRDVFSFLRDLARLLRAGLSIDDAMKLLLDMQEKERLKQVIVDLRERLRRGETLAASLSEHKDLFSVQIIAAVQAGELSGTLPNSLEAVADAMDKSLSFQERLRSALIYPTILLFMVAGTFALVMTFVLPQFAPLFEGNEDRLPVVTVFVMALADFIERNGWILLSGMLGGLVLFLWLLRDEYFKANLIAKASKIPFLRHWLLTPEVIRFTRTLGVCSKSGISLDKAIAMAIEAVKMQHVRDELARARGQVRRGELLSVALANLGWFPSLALQFTRVGEQSGNLGVMLEEASTIMGQDFETRMEGGLAILSPLLTLVMGGIVALLIGSVLLGIMSINDVAL